MIRCSLDTNRIVCLGEFAAYISSQSADDYYYYYYYCCYYYSSCYCFCHYHHNYDKHICSLATADIAECHSFLRAVVSRSLFSLGLSCIHSESELLCAAEITVEVRAARHMLKGKERKSIYVAQF